MYSCNVNCSPFFSEEACLQICFVNFHWSGVMLANEWDFEQVCTPILPLIWHREDWWERHDGANAYLVQQLPFSCCKLKFMILNLIPYVIWHCLNYFSYILSRLCPERFIICAKFWGLRYSLLLVTGVFFCIFSALWQLRCCLLPG